MCAGGGETKKERIMTAVVATVVRESAHAEKNYWTESYPGRCENRLLRLRSSCFFQSINLSC